MICQQCKDMADDKLRPLSKSELDSHDADANRHLCIEKGCTCQHREKK